MLKGATARRYAQAVFEIGVEQGTVDRWREDLRTLAEYYGDRHLIFVLREPKIPFARKEQMVRDLLGTKVQPEALSLALLLAERGLAEIGPAISTQFEKLYNDYRGQAVAQVTTAIPLDETLRSQIAADLQRITGKRILLQERVDPSILGGVVARVGDTLIDGSLRRRFALLREQIVQGGLGGPDDGMLASLMGPLSPDGGTSGRSGGNASSPFVVTPGTGTPEGASGSKNGGDGSPASSTEMTRRPSDAPHLGPRSGPQGGAGNSGNNNRNNRRRRR
ncbi:MAG: ATP synthase F1 subunit delta [Ktedonobacterales bacterium]